MRFPIDGGTITAWFDDPRPLSNPGEHVHGAIDIAAPVGTPIMSPEGGRFYHLFAQRADTNRSFGELDLSAFPFDFGPYSYFYDVYGAITLLFGNSGMVHLFAHTYMSQIYNRGIDLTWQYEESARDERFPVTALFTDSQNGVKVRAGAPIAKVGNAGYSTGAHVHYEIHHGARADEYAHRVRPELLYREVD